MPVFYEFFAGGGMARAGLGNNWTCAFANDIDQKKAASYLANWGGDDLILNDVAVLTPKDLLGCADLAWASFPCQDLSLAGAGAGLKGRRSGTFWPFWKLMRSLKAEGRAPRLIVLENVCGALNSHGGKDFAAIGSALAAAGYRFGAMVVDAIHFLPQSRPRLFFIAVQAGTPIPAGLTLSEPDPVWHSEALIQAKRQLSARAATKWVWWTLPSPPPRTTVFADLIEEKPQGVTWHTQEQTAKILGMMSPLNLQKVADAKKTGQVVVGGVYKRTRVDENGNKAQRAEVRFDDVAGCLRTPTGGSSRQLILVIKGKKIRSRLLSPREAARLMGLPDSYALPKNYNEAYHLAGDGVAVPVVRYLAANILEQILSAVEVMAAA
jgi:DNA (cytosine-5)-methyltransferase 1